MLKIVLLVFAVGFAAAQYGSGGGYGPDGVRNRYFILGHGRPITTSIGNGIYGPSAGPSSYGQSRSSGPAYSAPAPRPQAPAISHLSSAGYGSGLGGSGAGYGGPALSSGPSYGHSAPLLAPSYGHSAPAYAPAPRPAPAYAPAPRPAPAPRSYSAPSLGHEYGSLSAPRYSAPSGYGSHDDLAKPTPYDFGYDVHTDHGEQLTRQETGDGHGNVKGSYGYRDAYGLLRHVDYVADHAGFRANVRTNEPGTAPQDPADVHIQVEHGSRY